MWRRTGAMSVATVIAGALLLGSPAVSAADGEPTTPVGLEAALARDLQLTPAEFDALGELAAIASDALPKLKQIDGFAGISLSEDDPGTLLVAGTGGELERAVTELDAKARVKARIVSPESLAQDAGSSSADEAAPSDSPGTGQSSPESTPGSTSDPSTSAELSPEPVPSTELSPEPTPRTDQPGEPTPTPSASTSPTTQPTSPPSADATEAPSPGDGKAESSGPDSAEAPASKTPNAPTETATSATGLLNDYINAYGNAAVSRLQSIMQNAAGQFVIRMDAPRQQLRAATGKSAAAAAPGNFAAAYTNVDIAQADGPADSRADKPVERPGDNPADPPPLDPSEPVAQTPTEPLAHDVVGGLGTLTRNAGYVSVCSVGFNAYSPKGEPAALSAGHCTMDDQFEDVFLTDPLLDRAAKPGASNPETPLQLQYPNVLTELGTYTFSQFGTADRQSGIPAENVPATTSTGTDVAVISKINDKLEQLPAVTDWQTPSDPAASGPLVMGKTKPAVGAPVCKSGRTTGWTCGTIDAVGIFFVAGPDYATDKKDIRMVQGFGSHDLYSATGDSGGPMITGNYALGVLSAGGGSTEGGLVTFGAGIGPMLKAADGYSLQVFVRAPKLSSHSNGGTARSGELIRGTAPAGSEVRVTSGAKELDVSVTPEGVWSFHAPDEAGVLTFGVTASKGFNTSETSKYRLIIEEPPPPAPDKDEPRQDRGVAPAGGQSPAPLADTGVAADPLLFALLGGGLLTVGLLLLLTARRRASC